MRPFKYAQIDCEHEKLEGREETRRENATMKIWFQCVRSKINIEIKNVTKNSIKIPTQGKKGERERESGRDY